MWPLEKIRRVRGPKEPLYVRELKKILESEENEELPCSLLERAASLKGRLKFDMQQVTLALFTASALAIITGTADSFLFTKSLANNARQAAAIAYPQPPEDKILEARGFLAGKHVLYYDPSKPDFDPQDPYVPAYGMGLSKADPTLEPYVDILDQSRLCKNLVALEVNRQVGDRDFIDKGLMLGGVVIAGMSYVLYRMERPRQPSDL